MSKDTNKSKSLNISHTLQRLRKAAKAVFIKEPSEEPEQKTVIEMNEGEKNVGLYLKSGKDVITSSATSEAQLSGEAKKMASKAGLKNPESSYTTPTAVADNMDIKGEDSEKASLVKNEDGPTLDYSKMKSPVQEKPVWKQKLDEKLSTPEGRKQFSEFKSRLVQQRMPKGGVLNKNEGKVARHKDWTMEQHLDAAKRNNDAYHDFKKRGLDDRAARAEDSYKFHIDQADKKKVLNKNDESEGVKQLRENMKKPRQTKPGSVSEKIKAALDAQKNNPFRESTKAAPESDKSTYSNKSFYEQRRSENESRNTKSAKPALIRDLARYKKHTASGRPFRIMAGTHPDHKNLMGAHHVLENPLSLKQIHEEIKKPSSEINRRLYDALDQGYDSLYIHQPDSDMKQVGHLKVAKSGYMAKSDWQVPGMVPPKKNNMAKMCKFAKSLRKNMVMGYPEAPMQAPMAMSDDADRHMKKGK